MKKINYLLLLFVGLLMIGMVITYQINQTKTQELQHQIDKLHKIVEKKEKKESVVFFGAKKQKTSEDFSNEGFNPYGYSDELRKVALEEATFDCKFNLDKRPDPEIFRFQEALKHFTVHQLVVVYENAYKNGYYNAGCK